MLRKMLIGGLALAALAPGARAADTDGTGFATTPCTDPSPMPGSGAVHVAGPAAQYPPPVVNPSTGERAKTPAQLAVESAAQGDTVLLTPGVYRETLRVRTDNLRIRGTDRNAVVFDGSPIDNPGTANDQGQLEIGIDVTGPDNVVLENMTAHNYSSHGFFWHHAKGYWGRYLTAYNMGLYGIFAYDSRCGQFDRSYGSGNADSAFYIGQCFPCDAVITDIVAEQNGLGYSGTNAGGNLTLRDSLWIDNALAIVPNSLHGEDRPPQRGIIIRNNQILHNNGINVPGTGIQASFWGVGIALAGVNGNQVYGNEILDNGMAGIVITSLPDPPDLWIPSGNTIWGNTVTHDAGVFPDAFDLGQASASGPNNCWADNVFGNSAPPMIQDIYDCGLTVVPPGGDPRVEIGLISGLAGANGRTVSDWRTWPAPGPQPTQPSDNGTADLADDGAVDNWLPALGRSSA